MLYADPLTITGYIDAYRLPLAISMFVDAHTTSPSPLNIARYIELVISCNLTSGGAVHISRPSGMDIVIDIGLLS